jgi:hypothetical protein
MTILADRLREIAEANGSERLRTYRADFSSLDDVRRIGERFLAEQERSPEARVTRSRTRRACGSRAATRHPRRDPLGARSRIG